MWFDSVVLILYLPLHSSGMNVFHAGKNDEESNGPNLVGFKILFEFRFSRFSQDLGVI